MARGWKPKHPQAPEDPRSFWNQPITQGFNKKQPIKTPKIKRCWQTLKQAPSINTATFGPKVSLVQDSFRPLSPGAVVKSLREPKRQQWSGKIGWLVRMNLRQDNSEKLACPSEALSDYFMNAILWEWSSVRLFCKSQIMKMKFCQFDLWMLYCTIVALSGKLFRINSCLQLNSIFVSLLCKSKISQLVYSLRRWRFYLLPPPPRDAV